MNLSLHWLNRLQIGALVVGVLALGFAAYGAVVETPQFFFSYLFGYLFWLGLALGCFMVSMIHYLTGGRWGYPTRRILEAGFGTLPLLTLFFIPIFFGLPHLFPWARPEEVAKDATLQHRLGYMSSWAFVA